MKKFKIVDTNFLGYDEIFEGKESVSGVYEAQEVTLLGEKFHAVAWIGESPIPNMVSDLYGEVIGDSYYQALFAIGVAEYIN